MTETRSKVAYIDLTSGKVRVDYLGPEITDAFIGGVGTSFRLAQDLIKPGTDPLSPDNPIILGTGALGGTKAQAPRFSVVTKWPLTGCVAFGSGGMGFGVRMSRAGWDQIVITGRSPKRVYLQITDDRVEIKDAAGLWGKDTNETTDALWETIGKDYSVIAIGKTGENLVRISVTLVDKTSSFGKGGLPAIMGSKNLKAIAMKGTGKPRIANQEAFDKAVARMIDGYKKDPKLADWIKLGKLWFTATGDFRRPYKNGREIFPRRLVKELYSNEIYLTKIKGQRIGCTTCAYPCKDLLQVKEGKYAGLQVHLSSMSGRLSNLGQQAGGGCSFEDTVKLIDVANRLGVCTHQFAPVTMLVTELYERGVVTDKDTKGFVMRADFETEMALLNMVANREGIGDVIADGTLGVLKKFGKENEKYSCHIKGGEQQMDGRSMDFSAAIFCQVTNPEGGGSLEPAHVIQWAYPAKKYKIEEVHEFLERMEVPEESRARIFSKPVGYDVARITPYAEDFHIMLTALGICEYRTEHQDWGLLAELYSAASGKKTTGAELKVAGERIWNLFRHLNAREGFGRKDDRFPDRWREPWTEEGKDSPVITCSGEPVSVETFSQWLDDYYDERGWDKNTGTPGKQKLAALGIEDR